MNMKIKGWIARDKNCGLYLFENKPYKNTDYDEWLSSGESYFLDSSLFPEVTWEDDEPAEVEIEININI
jgi:hypothetical protein